MSHSLTDFPEPDAHLPATLVKKRWRDHWHSRLLNLPNQPHLHALVMLFAASWPFIKWIIVTLIVGGPVLTGINWFFVTAQENIPDWHKLVVIQLAMAHPLRLGVSLVLALFLMVCSSVSFHIKKAVAEEVKHFQMGVEKLAKLEQEEAERERRARPFVLKLVEELDPDKEPYIHQYIKDAYIFRDADTSAQGFPILIHRTITGEEQSQSLVKMGVKIAHLASHVANAEAIQQAQDGTIELSEQARNRAGAGLASILS